MREGLKRRWWDDLSWGALTSNGRLIYLIEDLGFALGADYQRTITRMDGRRQLDVAPDESTNVLAAYEARTGRLRWQIGEAFGRTAEGAPPCRFLAPPLPLDDLLYAVVDVGDEVRLLTLEADTGSVLRQWILETRENTLPEGFMPGRMLQEPPPSTVAPPVFSGGVLVCGTPARRFVGVDVVSGATLWTYAVGEPAEDNSPKMQILRMQGLAVREDRKDRWLATAALIVQDKVLLTAVGADDLHCVELRTGKPQWKAGRRDGLFLGAVRDERIVVVGRSGLRSLRLRDGREEDGAAPAEFLGGAVPAGRGYLADSTYYLPLSSGEVVGYDVASGRLVGQVLPSQPLTLGNLAPVGDTVWCCGLQGVQRFELLAAQRSAWHRRRRHRWAHAHRSPRHRPIPGLRDRARAALAAGNVEAAFELLAALPGTARTGPQDRLFARAVFLGLQRDAPRYAARLNTAECLPSADAAAASDWLSVAGLLAASGQRERALDVYERVLAVPQLLDQMVPVTAAQLVRLDRRVASGLEQLAAGGSAAADPLAGRLSRRLAETRSLAELNRYGWQAGTPAECLRLSEQLAGGQQKLEAELLLRKLLVRTDAAASGDATERLCRLLAGAGRTLEAERLRALQPPPAGPAAPAPANPAAPKWFQSKIAVQKKAAAKENQQNPLIAGQVFPVTLDSLDGTWACELSISYEMGSRTLLATDRWGCRRFRLTLPEIKPERMGYVHSGQMFFHAVTVGHLLFFYRGDIVIALDCLASEPKQLWVQEVAAERNQHFVAWRQMQMFWFNPFMRQRPPQAGMLPRAVAATADFVCFQQGETLLAADPLTGRTLWSRDDLPARSDLLTDGPRIYVTPPDGTTLSVLRAVDGSLLDRRPVLPLTERLGIVGGRQIRTELDAQKPQIGLYDVWEQKYVWQQPVNKEALVSLVGGAAVGVVEASGRVQLFDADSGRQRLAAERGQAGRSAGCVLAAVRERVCPGPEPEGRKEGGPADHATGLSRHPAGRRQAGRAGRGHRRGALDAAAGRPAPAARSARGHSGPGGLQPLPEARPDGQQQLAAREPAGVAQVLRPARRPPPARKRRGQPPPAGLSVRHGSGQEPGHAGNRRRTRGLPVPVDPRHHPCSGAAIRAG